MCTRRHLLATLSLAASLPPAAWAQGYPSQAITLTVPATPGGAIDIVARLIAPRLASALGQPVNVDNKPGAAGITGTELVARAAPDGHALALVASSFAINPGIYKKLPFDPVKSFEPVVLTHIVPLVLVVSNTLPAKTVAELIATLRAYPGRYFYASSGIGGAPHMSAELFKLMARVDIAHVPYQGSTAAHPDLIEGKTALMFDTVAAAGPLIKAGKVRGLAVTSARRSAALPELPTLAEAGLPLYDTSTWGGLLAPAGTPRPVIARLNEEVNKALLAPEVRDKLAAVGIEPAGGSPARFADFIRKETLRWSEVAAAAKIEAR